MLRVNRIALVVREIAAIFRSIENLFTFLSVTLNQAEMVGIEDLHTYWAVMGIYDWIACAPIDLYFNKSIVSIEQPIVCAHRQIITATAFLNRSNAHYRTACCLHQQSKEYHPNLH